MQVSVEGGWITLTGEPFWQYQKAAAAPTAAVISLLARNTRVDVLGQTVSCRWLVVSASIKSLYKEAVAPAAGPSRSQ